MATARRFRQMKERGEKIAAITAYDSSFAAAVHAAGIDVALVGDSLGMVVQGRRGTQAVSVEDIRYHTECVLRGAPDLYVMADLPFGSYETGKRQAFATAARLIAAGASMVKIEGGAEVSETVRYLTDRGIPVCGHVGLMPQAALASGFAVQGRSEEDADRILRDAEAVSRAGASLMVLEAIPSELAARISGSVAAATIGIGAGRECDGQILVLHDVLGVFPNPPSFAKDFMPEGGSIAGALAAYAGAVRKGEFPQAEHTPA